MSNSPGYPRSATSPSSVRVPSPHNRGTFYQLMGVLVILLLTVALGLYDGRRYGSLYIFGYITAVIYALHGSLRHNRPWQELGLKRGFVNDFKRVWYLFGIDALLFQVLPPTFGVAFVLGYYPELLSHITGRLSVNFGSLEGVSAVSLLAAALALTLIEEVVFRVTIQERLSWFLGTPTAILFASVIFGLVHAVGTSGSLLVILTDLAGVAIDGVFFGIIYAKTHNLALTWATHYIADVVGLIALVLIF